MALSIKDNSPPSQYTIQLKPHLPILLPYLHHLYILFHYIYYSKSIENYLWAKSVIRTWIVQISFFSEYIYGKYDESDVEWKNCCRLVNRRIQLVMKYPSILLPYSMISFPASRKIDREQIWTERNQIN